MSRTHKIFSLFSLFICFIIQGCRNSTNNNYAMSVYDLKNLIVLEEYLLGVLDRFRQELQYKVITIENYLEMTKKRNNSLEINKFAFNFEESVPIVRRLYFDYSRLVAFLDNNSWDVCIKAIYDQEPKLPTKKDLIETTNGLYIMQSVYSMKISKMAKGIFQGVDYNSSLNAFECFTMAMFLEELDELIYAKQWLEVSLDFYMKDTVNRDLYAELGFSSIMIYELYASVLHRLGNGRDNLTVNDTLRSLNPEGFGIEKDQIQEPDMFQKNDEFLDDRKATIVFYLSDVTQGGATAFPALNISVFPKKRSALMWYNLDNKGNGIPNSIHTACSTAVGSKWVMIKWLTQAAQMFRKPCLKEV
ncbi:uncharacterized protein [Drosophila bipectinata]|uniref:uncharacterized protein isoform X2 n=1 Tax=Drosophila bipectinata TaxID=42026 RepID=UPI0038B366FC